MVRREGYRVTPSWQEIIDEHKETTFQKKLDEMQEFIANTEKEGKIPMIKEHSLHVANPHVDDKSEARQAIMLPSMIDRYLDTPDHQDTEIVTPAKNSTLFTDRFLTTLAPIFIIRHPARVIQSFLKAAKELDMPIEEEHFSKVVDFQWSKMIFDYYTSLYEQKEGTNGDLGSGKRSSSWPIVIEADNLINDTPGTISKLCKLVGVYESLIRYTWDAQPVDTPVLEAFLGTLAKSTGVIKDKKLLEMPVIAEEAKLWERSYGADMAQIMVTLSEETLADYEYLYQFKI